MGVGRGRAVPLSTRCRRRRTALPSPSPPCLPAVAEHVDHRPAKAVMPAVAGMGAMGARQLEERGKGPE